MPHAFRPVTTARTPKRSPQKRIGGSGLSDPSGLQPGGTCDGTAQCRTPDGQIVKEQWKLEANGGWSVDIQKTEKAVLPGGIQISTTSNFNKLLAKTNENLKLLQKNHHHFGEDENDDHHQYVAAALNACWADKECSKSDIYNQLHAKLMDWQLENIPLLGAGEVSFGASVVGKGLARAGKLSKSGSPSRAGCSFPVGTLVLLADGSAKPIDQLSVGDNVYAMDPDSGKSGLRQVDATMATPDDIDFTVITIEGTQGAPENLTATSNHPFWSPSQKRWVAADDLIPGSTILTTAGRSVTVFGIQHEHTLRTAYNLTVRDIHTYYVLAGTTPVLVHNSCGPGGTVTVYRKQDTSIPQTMRLSVDEGGNVSLTGSGSLYVNMAGDISHSVSFKGDQLIAFDVPRSYVDAVGAASLPQRIPPGWSGSKRDWNRARKMAPDQSDGPGLFGLPDNHLPGLMDAIIPGSGRIIG